MLDFSNITEGLVVTVLGMLVVFAVLIVIAGILALTAKIIAAAQSNTKPEKNIAPQPVVIKHVPKPQPVATAPVPALDMELVAVITAAIAMETGKSTDQLVVRSIKRVKAWK